MTTEIAKIPTFFVERVHGQYTLSYCENYRSDEGLNLRYVLIIYADCGVTLHNISFSMQVIMIGFGVISSNVTDVLNDLEDGCLQMIEVEDTKAVKHG